MGASAALSYQIDRGAEVLRFLGDQGDAPLLVELSRLLELPDVVELTREAAMREDESDYAYRKDGEVALLVRSKLAREQVRAWCEAFLAELPEGS